MMLTSGESERKKEEMGKEEKEMGKEEKGKGRVKGEHCAVPPPLPHEWWR